MILDILIFLLSVFITGCASVAVLIALPHYKIDWDRVHKLATEWSDVKKDSKGDQSGSSDLDGIIIVITGPTAGIGYNVAVALHSLGATIIGVGRSPSKLKSLKDELDSSSAPSSSSSRFIPVVADLTDLESVSKITGEITSKHGIDHIDLLINNAGLSQAALKNPAMERVTKQGYEIIFGVNYLSHFLLTEKCLPLLKKSRVKSPRIVQVGSSQHQIINGSNLVCTYKSDPIGGNNGPFPRAAVYVKESPDIVNPVKYPYAESKMSQILHAKFLRRNLVALEEKNSQKNNIRIVIACPGTVATGIIPNFFLARILKQFAFPANGIGINSILNVCFLPSAGLTDTTDFIRNMTIPFFLEPTEFYSKHMLIEILRYVVACVWQKFSWGHEVTKYKTSEVTYNKELQDSLYKWSTDAVKEYL